MFANMTTILFKKQFGIFVELSKKMCGCYQGRKVLSVCIPVFLVTTHKRVYPKARIPKSASTEKRLYQKARIPKSTT
jgi:hypothetical protein